MSYWRFFAMIGTSTLVMFGLMYLNTYLWPHALFSETRAYMAVLMGATMAVIMLSFMLAMYTNRKANIAIFTGSVIVFAAGGKIVWTLGIACALGAMTGSWIGSKFAVKHGAKLIRPLLVAVSLALTAKLIWGWFTA